MKKIFYTLVVVLIGFSCSKAQQDVLTRISSSIELTPYATGYINSSGDTIIPIGKYPYCFTERFDKIAIIVPKKNSGFYAIDRNEKVLFEVVGIDNGPDYVKDGLFRIKKNEKIGFANMNGEIVIMPKFDSAMPFSNGFSAVCIGGKSVVEYEHTKNIGGKWGFINKSGKLVVPLIYDQAWSVKDGKALVEKNKEKITIDIK